MPAVGAPSGSCATRMPARQHRTAMVERVLSSTHASCPVTPSCAHALGAKTAMARLSPYRTTKSIRGLRPLHLGRAASAAPLGSGSDYSIDALVTPTKPKPQMSEFAKRCVSGALLGAACSVAVISGGTPFVAMMVLLVVQVSKEYWGFVSAKEMAKGLPASSNWVAMACSAVCAGMVVSTYLQGRPQVWLAAGAFAVLALELVSKEIPSLSTIANTTLGVFYCGFLPSFWVQLRGIAIPSVHSSVLANAWPTLLGGPTHITVGLVATMTTMLAIIAADTGAYLIGRAFGRTQLTPVSPKKTVEGAVGGMLSATITVMALCKLTNWPSVWWGAPLLGVTAFVTSLTGDLLESSMKRDAGLKDSGDVIPGHGGVLDRFDSYIFTGPMVFFLVKYVFPLCGV